MLVKDWMSTNIVWIDSRASIQEALKVMKHHEIRHLPVKDEEGNFVGWITDADLRSVLIASMLEKLTVADIMIREPYIISPDSYLEEAAILMVTRKIGGLPVIEDGKLVGIITVVDVLRAFVEMIGSLKKTERIDFYHQPGSDYDLSEIVKLIQSKGGKVFSICKFLDKGVDEGGTYSIHVEGGNREEILSGLKRRGVQLLSFPGLKPPKKASKFVFSGKKADTLE